MLLGPQRTARTLPADASHPSARERGSRAVTVFRLGHRRSVPARKMWPRVDPRPRGVRHRGPAARLSTRPLSPTAPFSFRLERQRHLPPSCRFETAHVPVVGAGDGVLRASWGELDSADVPSSSGPSPVTRAGTARSRPPIGPVETNRRPVRGDLSVASASAQLRVRARPRAHPLFHADLGQGANGGLGDLRSRVVQCADDVASSVDPERHVAGVLGAGVRGPGHAHFRA
jgi:hypothetical protein